jgi:hypothetical protein
MALARNTIYCSMGWGGLGCSSRICKVGVRSFITFKEAILLGFTYLGISKSL